MRTIRSTTLVICAVALLVAGCAAQKPKPDDSKSQSQTQKDSSSGSKAPASAASDQKTKPAPAPDPSGSSAMPEPTRTATANSDGTSGGGGRAQTPDERRASLDKQLEGSLGSFDDTLRREQKAVAEEKDANDAAASGGGDSSDSQSGDESGSAKSEGPPAEASEPGRSRNETPSRPGDLKSDKDRSANDSKPGGGTGATGEKIPDGSDDDIVAKRLRKAAEQETDPELKEKLWKEYIEYKKNAGK